MVKLLGAYKVDDDVEIEDALEGEEEEVDEDWRTWQSC